MTDPLLLAISRAIAETGWSSAPMAEWAKRADLSLSDVHARFPHKFSILLAWHQAADRGMLADLSSDEQEGPVGDRLFALLMRRFDALLPGRAALALLPDRHRGAPHLLLALTPHLVSSMIWALEAARLARGGIMDVLRAKPLAFAYGSGLRAFMTDPSPDLSETMKTLDLALKRLQTWPLALPSVTEEPRPAPDVS